MINSQGLKWVYNLWGSEPRWTVQPDQEAIKRTIQSALDISDDCTIEFLAQGAFNKIYVVKSIHREVVARVTLPVAPGRKTLSEVATMEWVRKSTSLPVPRVFAYQAHRPSPVGFEWIAMSRVPGKPLAAVWRTMTFDAKEILVRQLARFHAEVFDKQLRGIGNIFPEPTESLQSNTTEDPTQAVQGSGSPQVQRIVSASFIWGHRILHDVPRGPFSSSRDWLAARLDIADKECQRRLSRLQNEANQAGEEDDAQPKEPSKDGDIHDDDVGNGKGDNESSQIKEDGYQDEEDDDLEDLENTMTILSRLLRRLDGTFPVNDSEPEPSVIFHDDLSRHNILVDEAGVLTSVIDWECISALPLWAACQFPNLLESKPSDEKPVKEKYHRDENGQVADLYWEHLDNYELTQLRRSFLTEMRMLQPKWVDIYESSEHLRDFDMAVTTSDDPFMLRRLLKWLDDVEAGIDNVMSLGDRIDQGVL